MCCLVLIASGLGPRIALAIWWTSARRSTSRSSTWIWPLLGLIFLPWTTLFYVMIWSIKGGVSGAEWLFVGLGVVLDIATYSARSAQSR